MNQTVVEVENLNFSYNANLPALQSVNFQVKAGDVVCMVGPNGGGKSTLLKLLCGFLKPDSGSIKIFGKSPEEARQRVGYMPQMVKLDSAFPVSALEVVMQGGIRSSFGWLPNRACRDKALEIMKRLEVVDLQKKRCSELSGGQYQRVLLARSLMVEPELLLLDEPTAGADIRVQERFHELLHSLRDENLTMMVVSHHMQYVCGCYDYALCINNELKKHELTKDIPPDWSELFGHSVGIINHACDCNHDCNEVTK